MYIDTVRMTPDNVETCAFMWAGGETYGRGELHRVIDAAALLLSQQRARGAIILEDGQPRAFGISTFVQEHLINEYLNDPHPHLGRRLLLSAHNPHVSGVLELDEIAERNAGSGLNAAVANANIDPDTRDPAAVMAAIIAATFEVHRGYRIVRYINEVFGRTSVSMVASSGSFEIRRTLDLPVGTSSVPWLLATITRAEAAASTNAMLAMFAYSPPRLHFTRAEQLVLAEALAGATDKMSSARLGISISAVKARWIRIQEKVACFAPDLFNTLQEEPRDGRGVQTRHLILRYVRDHPSELTPYAWPRTTRRQPCVTRSRLVAADR